MSFFGMGSMEIVVIMVIALIIFGPGKLPEIAGQAGKMVRDFRRATRDLTAEFQDSIDDVQSTMNEMKSTVSDMKRETEELASSIPAAINEGVGQPLSQVSSAVRNTEPTARVQADVSISEAPAPVATKNDPFADLIDMQDEPGGASRSGAGG
jgi:TatA/E family protein of Tat protein translocase